MLSFKSISYEEMRLEYFRKQRDAAERRMNYWCRSKQADRVGWMEASDRASEAGAQYNFYNDTLEALKFVFEWITTDEGLPMVGDIVYSFQPDSKRVDISRVVEVKAYNIEVKTLQLQPEDNYTSLIWAPVPLPEPPKEE